MKYAHNRSLSPFAKELRKNMTKEERHLWYDFLRQLPIRFLRQKVIGSYIVDFYCASSKLVIELDGSQHYEAKGRDADMSRDAFLRSLGLTVLRYSNRDINENFNGVCEDILRHIKPSPSGGRWPSEARSDEGKQTQAPHQSASPR